MAEAKRHPSVGKHMLAYYALQGDEDVEFVREYVAHAVPILGDIIEGAQSGLDEGAQTELVGLMMFLSELERALADGGDSEFRIEIRRRKAGKPINRFERARVGRKAAAMVEAAVQTGMKQEAAIADAERHTGLSRSEIFLWLKSARGTRARMEEYFARRTAERESQDDPPPQSG